jgi:hypothetical protein
MHHIGKRHGVIEIGFFDEKRVGSEPVGSVDVVESVGRGKHDHRQRPKAIALANPGKNLKPVHSWELQVQKDEGGQGEFGSIAVFTFTCEISQGLIAGPDDLNGIANESFVKGSSHEENVVLFVFDY